MPHITISDDNGTAAYSTYFDENDDEQLLEKIRLGLRVCRRRNVAEVCAFIWGHTEEVVEAIDVFGYDALLFVTARGTLIRLPMHELSSELTVVEVLALGFHEFGEVSGC
jgi:hypothetical protein